MKKVLKEMTLSELKDQLSFHSQCKSIYPYFEDEIKAEIEKRQFEKSETNER